MSGIPNNNKIIIVWGMPLISGNAAQTTCGIEKVENLKKHGFEIHLIYPKFPNKIWREGSSNWLLLALYQPILLIQLFWTVKRVKPGVIHSSSPLVLPPLVVCKIMGIPHVVEAHGVMFEEAKLYNAPLWQICLMRISEQISYNISSKILANAPGTKERMIEKFKVESDKIVTIPNGANTHIFKPMVISKTSLGLSDDYDYICFVGNLLPWQGVQYLISSAPRIIEKRPATKFLIIGDGIMKESLIAMIKETGLQDSFIFTGLIPYRDVPKYINASTLCVAPFIREKDNKMSPLKILEYMACEKPVITTNIRGAGDIISEYECGLAVNSEDSEELAMAIIELLENKERCQKMGINGRQLILKDYDWEAIAKKIKKVYCSLCNQC